MSELPTWDQAVSAPPQQGLPSWDDALATPDKDEAPKVGPLFSSAPEVSDIKPPVAEYLKNTSMGKIATAFGHGFNDSFDADTIGLSKDDLKDLKIDNETLNDLNGWHKKFAYGARDGLIVPSAFAMNAAYRGVAGVFSGVEEAVGAVAGETGIPGAEKEAKFTFESAGEGFPLGKGSLGIPHPKALPRPIAEARSLAVIGEGEKGYFGLGDPTPEQLTERHAAAAEVHTPVEPPPLSVHEIARNLAPETFAEYDDLSTRRDTMGKWIRDLNEKRQADAEASAPHNAEIAELQAKMEDANPRKSKIYQDKIDTLVQKNKDYVESEITKDNPDLARVRADYQKADYRMRDMAEEVSAAYREAKTHLPEEVPEEPKVIPAEAVIPQEPHGLKLSAEAQMAELEKQHDALPEGSPEREAIKEQMAKLSEQAVKKYKPASVTHPIVSDVTKKLTAAGRPEEEARAAAQLVKAHYDARSQRFGGKKGTAEEMYERDMADIKAGKNKARILQNRELAQHDDFWEKQEAIWQEIDDEFAAHKAEHERIRLKLAAENSKVWDDLRDYIKNDLARRFGDINSDVSPPSSAAKVGKDHLYTLNKDDLVEAGNGKPISFVNQKSAAKWIVDIGHKESKNQIFEIVNHPDGVGFSVRKSTTTADIGEALSQGGRELAQSKQPPEFYSALERSIESMPQGKGSVDQWRGIINNLVQKGVKQEEIHWSGVRDWLSQQEGNVTKQQVMDYLRANQLRVEEVVKGAPDMGRVEQNGDVFYAIDESGQHIGTFDTSEDAAYHLNVLSGAEPRNATTKFSGHTLPGGENYRELLVTLPERVPEAQKTKADLFKEEMRLTDQLRNQDLPVNVNWMREHPNELNDTQRRVVALRDRMDKMEGSAYDNPTKTQTYQSSHFEEPNILAHLRFNERTDASGKKTMFIEEVQSDWHQQGREKGYKIEAQRRILQIDKRLTEIDKAVEASGPISPEMREEMRGLVTEREMMVKAMRDGVPDAPFKTSWPELAFKRALMWAVEHDFDSVSWTTGEQQAARYDLSKKIDELLVTKNDDGTYNLEATLPGAGMNRADIGKSISADKLSDYIGKEMAEKISKQEHKSDVYDAADLKIGGEGMKAFYDKMLPSMVNKLVKKWGGKVEETHIATDKGGVKDVATGERVMAAEGDLTKSDVFDKVHSLEITPEMRESVEGGLPLFQGARGKIRLATEESKAMITLFKSADASTFIHETGHHWLDELMRDASDMEAPQDLLNDAKTVRDWLGVTEGAEIPTKAHEKFARGFERYMMEGVAPTKELAGIFAKFKDWLTKLYQMVEKLKSPITDDIRHVFDRLLSVENKEPVVAEERVQPTAEAAEPSAAIPPPEGTAPPAEKGPPTTATTTLPKAASEFVDKAGNIRLENLNTPEDVNVLVREISDQNEGFIASRGVIPDDMVMSFAEAAGIEAWEVDLKALAEKFGYGNLSSMIIGGRKLFIDSATKLRDAMNKAATGDDEAVMAYAEARARHIMIQEHLSAVTAETGRALRAFHEIGGGAEDAQMLGEFLKQNTGKTLMQLKEEAALGAKLDTPQKVSKFINDNKKPTKTDMLMEFWINALLSGPRTHVTNILSNTLVSINSIVETAAAAGVSKILRSEDGVAPSEAKARLFGLFQGAQDGTIAAGKYLKNEDMIGATKLEQSRPKAIPGIAGKAIRMPGRLLAAEDQIFKGIAYRQELNALAYRTATKEGLNGNAFASRVAEIVMSPTEEMMKAAIKAADYQTFNNPLGPNVRPIAQWSNAHPLFKFILPFIRTPTNIVKYAGERSPFGLLSKEINSNLKGANGAAARDTQIARMALGTTVGVATMLLTSQGKITGGGPADPKEKAVLYQTGWQPYSFKIGDTFYSYARMEPLGMIFGVSADMAEIGHHLTDLEADKLAAMTLASVAKNLTSKTWIKGPSDLIQAISDPERYGNQYLEGFISSFVPTGIAQITQTNDPVLRDARTMLDSIKTRIPGLSKDVMPRRDIWGNEISREGSLGPDLISPIFETRLKDDPVSQRMLALHIFPAKPDRDIRGVKLTPKQYDDYSRLAGRMTKQRLDAIIKVPGFISMPDYAQTKVIKKTIENSRETARSLVMMQNPEIIKQATDNKLQAMQGTKP